ncbi:1-acyl-sn-glycerol-3-phosphate acyltransferase [Colwellia sp. MEBiC06753]
MKRFIQYLFLLKIKYVAKSFYRFNVHTSVDLSVNDWQQVKLIVLLNHTSLFEPILLGVAPNSLVKTIANKLIIPAAESTLKRPFAGKLLKTLIPGCVPITRKKDASWQYFLDQIDHDNLTAILPEGRMKRRNGLDKHGKPMTIKPGVAEILQRINSGQMLVVYSGGLHHIQAPGDKLPKVFKTIDVGLELIDIAQYKAGFDNKHFANFQEYVVSDLQQRLAKCDQLASF